MHNQQIAEADSTAVRVALWRALHVQIDPPPHVFDDEIGLKLVAPDDGWLLRPDMDPHTTRHFRASIVARARFIEDLLVERMSQGISQYVILGAGLDTFAQRRPEIASRLRVFEVDRSGPQIWKRQRLLKLNYNIPTWLRFVAVDFEQGELWWDRLADAGFDPNQPTFVASTGVSMYLTQDAIAVMLRQIALTLTPGSLLAKTFLLPLELVELEERSGFETAKKGAQTSGTPFISFFTPQEMLELAREAGFKEVQHVSSAALAQRYFSGRSDGLCPGSEHLLVAIV